ncbi:tenascin-X-like [Liolophura sinensis]|uniref:tenascin-X-like n=1 Tax=Liolophura sinensis TaxID=3198878 RepID=UPI0031595B51
MGLYHQNVLERFNGKVYQRGQTYPKDCNTCTCNGLTGGWDCTTQTCWKQCTYGGKVYQRDQTYPKDCNTCTCNGLTGLWDCTANTCWKDCRFNGQVYQRGQTHPQDCNTCTCNGLTGEWDCTTKTCWKQCTYGGKVYQRDQTYPKDCNTCTCNGLTGLWDCTANTCWKDCRFNGQVYQRGQTYPKDCNTCTCNGLTGEWDCTTKTCWKQCTYGGKVYQRDQTYPKDCNTCTCNGLTGLWDCTTNTCWKECTFNGKVYQRGQTHPKDCNTCTCNGYTGRWDCTTETCWKHCRFNGQVYQRGQTHPKDCNTCTCNGLTGGWDCTTDICYKGCVDGDYKYYEGEAFRKDCNLCVCHANHVIACSSTPCGDGCPAGGITPYQCGSATCQNSVCPAYPEAQCLGFCNRCITRFFVQGNDVTDYCSCDYHGVLRKYGETFFHKCNKCLCLEGRGVACSKHPCPPGGGTGIPPVIKLPKTPPPVIPISGPCDHFCPYDPCSEVCKSFPNAKCQPDHCGSCTPKYTVDGVTVNCNGKKIPYQFGPVRRGVVVLIHKVCPELLPSKWEHYRFQNPLILVLVHVSIQDVQVAFTSAMKSTPDGDPTAPALDSGHDAIFVQSLVSLTTHHHTAIFPVDDKTRLITEYHVSPVSHLPVQVFPRPG